MPYPQFLHRVVLKSTRQVRERHLSAMGLKEVRADEVVNDRVFLSNKPVTSDFITSVLGTSLLGLWAIVRPLLMGFAGGTAAFFFWN
jgi:hypothetical protein